MKKGRFKRYKPWTPYLFLLPAFTIMIIFIFWPLVQVFLYSFQEYNIFEPAKWVGFKNYQAILKDKIFFKAFINTVIYFIGVVPLLVVVPLAYPNCSFSKACSYK